MNGVSDDRREFFISPVIEKRLSTGTDDAQGVRKTRASKTEIREDHFVSFPEHQYHRYLRTAAPEAW